MNMKKMTSAIMMAATMLLSTVFAVTPAVVSTASAANEITADNYGSQLGVGYAQSIGLGSADLRLTIAKVIRVAMGLLGIIAVIIILIGGFTWMTAGGNEEKVGEAKKWIFSGIIGLFIILSAFAIAQFVISQLVKATTDSSTTVPLN